MNRFYVLIVAAITLHATPFVEACAADFRTVALSGQQAPGANPGQNFGTFAFTDQFHGLSINDHGMLAFRGNLTNSGVANASGIWSEGTGSLTLIAKEGAAAPGTESGTVFGSALFTPIVNDQGQTMFFGQLAGPSVGGNAMGIWSGSDIGNLELRAREGNVAPDIDGVQTYGFLNEPVRLNDDGRISFVSVLGGPGVDFGNRTGVWSDGHGAGMESIAFVGDSAPGTPVGVVFGTELPYPPSPSPFQSPLLNSNGQSAFIAGLKGAGTGDASNFGIWREDAGTGLSLVARFGMAAPGTAGATFYNFVDLAFNRAGQTAFTASLTGGGTNHTNNVGIWKESTAGLELVARSGDPLSELGPDAKHLSFRTLALNSSGQVAVYGTVSGAGIGNGNDEVIWRSDDSGGLHIVAREGSPAPGTIANFGFFSTMVYNNLGQTAFMSSLRGPGAIPNRFGIWAEDVHGNLQLIIREGDFIDVDNDPLTSDLRQVADLEFFSDPNSEGGQGSLFNNRGQLAFTARFVGGSSGIFVSNLVAVPEPTTIGVAFVAVVLIMPCRRRKPGPFSI